MIWRTDKPTADVIVAEIKDRGYKIMYISNADINYYLDDNGEEYSYTEFVKWADLEEDEKQTDISTISNNLKEAAEEYAKDETMSGLAERAFKAGAKWQREQDHDACYRCEKNYDNVFYKGEQHAIKMMKEEAIERTVKEDAGGYPYIDETELYDYDKDEPTAKKGDKVKVYVFR